MRQHLTELKAHIVEGCKNTLTALKKQGVSALDGIGRFFRVEPMLKKIGKVADKSVQIDSKAIEKIQALSSEYHEAGRHLKNMGRTFLGKDVIEDAKSPGKFAALLTAPYKANKSCMLAAKQNVEKALENLSQLHERVQQRTSVLKRSKKTVIRFSHLSKKKILFHAQIKRNFEYTHHKKEVPRCVKEKRLRFPGVSLSLRFIGSTIQT